jgi:hypothetical protein
MSLLLGDLRTAPGRVELFHFDDGTNENSVWTFRSRFRSLFGVKITADLT